MNKLTRQQLELINRKTIRYPLQIAAKDYYLALAIQMIYNSPLGKKLIFKGGSAIHHCYLPQKRFSEDLDFTSLDPEISLDQIAEVLESGNTFRINKSFESDFTIKIERLQYQDVLGQPGNIKFEVDHHQNVVLPGVGKDYQNVWNVTASPLVMDQREICAEKLRAVAQRARYRDFYDLYFLLQDLSVSVDGAVEILKQKEIRSPISVSHILANWSIAKEQMAGDLGNIYTTESIADHELERVLSQLQFDDIPTNR